MCIEEKQYAFTYFTKLCGKANFNRKMNLYYIFIVVAFDFFIMSMLLFLYGDRFEFYCIITLYTLGRKLSGNFERLQRDRNLHSLNKEETFFTVKDRISYFEHLTTISAEVKQKKTDKK